LPVITVPHFVCPKTIQGVKKKHPCDSAAETGALLLEKYFGKKKIVTKVFLGDIERKKCDLNRAEESQRLCSSTFRSRVTNYVKSSKVFVFDVHSYPTNKKWSNRLDFYLLDETPPPFCEYSRSCVKYMQSKKVSCTVLQGKPTVNDIMFQMRKLGKPCFLVEFNEALLQKEKRFEYVCKTMVDWFVNEEMA
jgi:succinylglutamate desuccinylase